MREADNLERGLYCGCLGCYPRLSGEGSELINKVLTMERLPRRFHIVEHRQRQLLHAESPVPARGVSAIRPGPVFFGFFLVCLPPLIPMNISSAIFMGTWFNFEEQLGFVTMPSAPTPQVLILQLFLDFRPDGNRVNDLRTVGAIIISTWKCGGARTIYFQ